MSKVKKITDYEKYSKNPSIEQAIKKSKTNTGAKIVFNQSNKMDTEITSYDDNDNISSIESHGIDFTTTKIVDKDRFIKVYVDNFPILSDLKNSAKTLFYYILDLIAEDKYIDKDEIYISYLDYELYNKNLNIKGLSKATFYKSLNELLNSNVLFRSELQHIYYINITYIFNGDRLRFITEYQKKQ